MNNQMLVLLGKCMLKILSSESKLHTNPAAFITSLEHFDSFYSADYIPLSYAERQLLAKLLKEHFKV